MVDGGRRARQREKTGEGKMVRALTRMFVTVSGCSRCGLNWYLVEQRVSQMIPADRVFLDPRRT